MPDEFASVFELAATLQRTVPDDAALVALQRASGAIRSYCGWTISREVVVGAKISPMGRRRVWLPTLYLVSVQTVVEDGVTLVAGTDYDFDSTGLLVRDGRWTTTMNGLVVSYTHGYGPLDWPAQSARGVCLSAASRVLANPSGHSSDTAGPYSWTAGAALIGRHLTTDELTELDPLVLPVLG